MDQCDKHTETCGAIMVIKTKVEQHEGQIDETEDRVSHHDKLFEDLRLCMQDLKNTVNNGFDKQNAQWAQMKKEFDFRSQYADGIVSWGKSEVARINTKLGSIEHELETSRWFTKKINWAKDNALWYAFSSLLLVIIVLFLLSWTNLGISFKKMLRLE